MRCGPIHTGAAPPYPGTVKQVGKYLVVDAQVGENVSFPVGLYGSLRYESLKWFKLTKKVHGKTVGFNSSVGCLKGKRPISTTFTAEQSKGGTHQSVTIKSSAKC